MSYSVKVEVPAYCTIPYNNVRCRFLKDSIIGKLFYKREER